MDLQEEYFSRRAVRAHLVKFVDRGNLILRAKNNGKKPEWNWLHVTIQYQPDAQHPGHYIFTVAANPVIYASADFTHFTQHHTKVLKEDKFEWEQYEDGILKWAEKNASHYDAVPSSEAIFVSWELFLSNYDTWVAAFLPIRVTDWLCASLEEKDSEKKLDYIKKVEEWIHGKYERVYVCWKNIRQNLEQKNYADWLATIVNNQNLEKVEERKVKVYKENDLVYV